MRQHLSSTTDVLNTQLRRLLPPSTHTHTHTHKYWQAASSLPSPGFSRPPSPFSRPPPPFPRPPPSSLQASLSFLQPSISPLQASPFESPGLPFLSLALHLPSPGFPLLSPALHLPSPGLPLPSPGLSPGSDGWPWWTCHVCPWPRKHRTFTASCSLLWCQRSAILQNQILQENLWLKLLPTPAKSCSFPWPFAFPWLGWPLLNPRMTFMTNLSTLRVFVWMFWMSMDIISGHAEKYLSYSLGLAWVLWSSLTERLRHDPGFLNKVQKVSNTRFIHGVDLAKYYRYLQTTFTFVFLENK